MYGRTDGSRKVQRHCETDLLGRVVLLVIVVAIVATAGIFSEHLCVHKSCHLSMRTVPTSHSSVTTLSCCICTFSQEGIPLFF